MTLKEQVDFQLRKTYSLVETIKKLEPSVKENKHAKLVLGEVLREYVKVSSSTRELIYDYIQEERKRGITPLEYVRLYRKFGET